MDKQPAVSVIVPVYKAENYLCHCVDSLLAQTFPDFEILLIDDGSPDHSGDICVQITVLLFVMNMRGRTAVYVYSTKKTKVSQVRANAELITLKVNIRSMPILMIG